MWSSAGRALLVLALGLAACRGEEPPAIERVVFVTIDTLRADHLGAYGYPRGTSPFLNALASQGLLLKRTYATSSLTAVSHASLFTSLYPTQPRVVQNWMKISPRAFTLARLFRDAGFETAGFPSVRFLGGMRPGFDTYAGDVRIQTQHSKGPAKHQDAEQTIDRVMVWLHEGGTKERFFVWIHLFDVHQYGPDYSIRPRFENLVKPRNEEETRALDEWLATNHYLPRAEPDADPEASQRIRERVLRYDAQIRFVDDQLKRLFAHLEAVGLGDRTLWVVTADHGEGLGNHGYEGHSGHLYDEQIHVPGILYLRDSRRLRGELDAVVRHVDLMPTLADLAGIPLPEGVALRGRSILPLLDREAEPEERYAYSERGWDDKDKRKEGQVAALRSGSTSYILRSDGSAELYDLARDPFELENRAEGARLDPASLHARVEELMAEPAGAEPPRPGQALEHADPEVIENLEALGYLEGD